MKKSEAKPKAIPHVGVSKGGGLATSSQKLAAQSHEALGSLPFPNAFDDELKADRAKPKILPSSPATVDFDKMFAPSVVDLPKGRQVVLPAKRRHKKVKVKALTGKSPHVFRIIRLREPKETKPNVQVPINKELIALGKQERKGYLATHSRNQRLIMRFLVRDLAPKLLPALSAIDDAKEVLREIVGVEVDSDLYGKMMKWLQVGAQLKLGSWVSKYLGLNAEETRLLFQKLELRDGNGNNRELSRLQALYQMLRSQKGS